MICKCYDCGETFDEDDAIRIKEPPEEFWGDASISRITLACPFCGGDFDDAAAVDEWASQS